MDKDDFKLRLDEARVFDLLISQEYDVPVSSDRAQGFVEVSGPAGFKKRWPYQLTQQVDHDGDVLARFKNLTFKILEIKISDNDYCKRVLLALKHHNINSLAKVVDTKQHEQKPEVKTKDESTQSKIKQEPTQPKIKQEVDD